MRRLALVASIAVLLSVFIQAQDFPHAFPRTGTTQLFDNARVTAWDVNWIHGVPQPVHRHRYDMAGVYLRFGQITVTRPDGSGSGMPGPAFEVPRPYFQVKDITHREEAKGQPGDPERLAIMLDLKEGGAPTALPPMPGVAAAFPREGAKNVLENPRVRMWDYTWRAGAPTARHLHDTDTVEVYVTGGVIRTRTADGKDETRTVKFKDARFVPRGRVDSEELVSGEPRAIIIELLR